MILPVRSHLWLDFVGTVEPGSHPIRLRGHDGGVVEFDSSDVQVSGHLISVRLDADARLVEARLPRDAELLATSQFPERAIHVGHEQTIAIGLVVFSCRPFKPIGICFDVAEAEQAAAC